MVPPMHDTLNLNFYETTILFLSLETVWIFKILLDKIEESDQSEGGKI